MPCIVFEGEGGATELSTSQLYTCIVFEGEGGRGDRTEYIPTLHTSRNHRLINLKYKREFLKIKFTEKLLNS